MFLIQNVPPLFLQHFGIFADPTKHIPVFTGLRLEIILLVGRRYCAEPTKHKSPFGLVCKEFY